ncbi:MAG: tandem-95 repeat protein [Verrucomicrobiae bacterium]|nr:tandem-95 repeat protein [Verrucomicrobiae bacterium]
MATLGALLAAYDLKPGDRVFIDVGSYTTTATILIDSQDAGVEIIGAGETLTSLIYTSTAEAIRILDAPGISLTGFTLDAASASIGVSVEGGSTGFSADAITINTPNIGIAIGVTATGATVNDTEINGAGRGIDSLTAEVTITGNTIDLPGTPGNRYGGIVVEDPSGSGALIENNTVSGYGPQNGVFTFIDFGIYINAADYSVLNNIANQNSVGFWLAGGGSSSGNQATFNDSFGFHLAGSGTHDNNTANNNDIGFRTGADFTGTLSNSFAEDNGTAGILVAGGNVVGNTITATASNGADGIRIEFERDRPNFSAAATPSVVSGNTISDQFIGIAVRHGWVVRNFTFIGEAEVANDDGSSLILGNVVFDSLDTGILIDGLDYDIDFQHNTVVESGIDAVSIIESTQNITLENNIFVTDGAGFAALRVAPTAQRGFSADWNVYHATGSADHIHWQAAFNDRALWWLETGFDAHSQFVDPQFTDAPNDDYTLLVTSPARGMADPDSSRVNIGAFDDALALDTYRIVGPFAGQKLLGGQSIELTWQTRSATSGTVMVEYSIDGGSNWITIIGSTADDGSYTLTLPTPGAPVLDARLRISDTGNAALLDVVSFSMGIPTTTFFVDPSGTPGNTGTTAGDPLPSLAAVLHAHDLPSGGSVQLGIGTYETFVPLSLPDQITISGDAVLDRNNINLGGELFVVPTIATLIDLELANAWLAIDVPALATLADVTIRDSILGLRVTGEADATGVLFQDNVTAIELSGSLLLDQSNLIDNDLGIDLTGTAVLIDTDVTGGITGARIEGGELRGGTFSGQSSRGLLIEGADSTLVAGVRIENAPIGIEFLASDGTHRIQNGIFSGNLIGVQANGALDDGGALLLLNNTFHGVGVTHLQLINSINVRVINHIFAGSGSTAIEADTASAEGFVSDHTLFDPALNRVALWQGNTFADLVAWQVGTGLDPHALSGDPLFVNAGAGDFHLTVASPGVDAGDPFLQVGAEPSPNGGRSNLGAYGLTVEAATSPIASLTVTSPSGNARIERGSVAQIEWASNGFGAITAAENYRDAILALSPSIYLNLDGSVNGLTTDYSLIGSDFAGALQNGVLVGVPGAFNQSGGGSFDGIDDQVLLPNASPLLSGGEFSISVWFFAETGIENDAELLGMHRSGLLNGFVVYHDNGEIRFRLVQGGTSEVAAAITLDTWNHLTLTYQENSEQTLYLNGVEVDSTVPGQIWVPETYNLLNLGGGAAGWESWKGGIDEFAMFDRALSAAEVSALYGSPVDVPGSEDVSIRVNGQLIAAALQDDGSYAWNVPGSFPEGPATLTLEANGVTGVSQTFLIVPAGNHYYINDDAVNSGDLTTAVGSDLNSGKSVNAPMRNLSELLRLYDLGPGDVIHVDVGTYSITSAIEIGLLDAGVSIIGPESSVGTALFDRGNRDPGTMAFHIVGTSGITIENLSITGADLGILVEGSTGFTLRNSLVFENASGGLSVDSGSADTLIENNEFYGVGSNGVDETIDQDVQIDVRGSGITVTGNTVYQTGSAEFGVFSNDKGIYVRADDAVLVTGNTVFNLDVGFDLGSDGGEVSGNVARDNNHGFQISNGTFIFQGAAYTQVFGNLADDNLGDGFLVSGVVEIYDNLARENDIGFNTTGTGNPEVKLGVSDSRGGNVAALNRVGILARTGDILNNVTYGNTENGITIGGLAAVYIAGNRAYSNGNFGIGVSGTGVNSQMFATQVENNLVYDNGNGGISYNVSGSFSNQVVRNNTVVQDTGVGILINNAASGFTLTNNLVTIAAGDGIEFADGVGANWVSDFNLVHVQSGSARFGTVNGLIQTDLSAWQTATGTDANSVVGDPIFVDPDGADNILGYDFNSDTDGGADDNFQLTAGSPAIDAGESVDAPTVDIDGLERRDDPGAPNAGTATYYLSNPASGSVFDSALGGTALNLNGQNIAQSVALPFAFSYFGIAYTSVFVSSNGLLQFDGATNNANSNGNSSANLHNYLRIAALWDNLRTDQTGDDVFMEVFADRVVFRWDASNPADGNSDVQFAVTLYTTGDIRFDYGSGNANLTPTAGISDGTSTEVRHTLLTDADGLIDLGNHQSTLFTWGPGYTDIGAHEFGGSSNDTTPPSIVSVTPGPVASGGIVYGDTLTEIAINFSEALLTIDAIAPGSYELVEAGLNETFGDLDDVFVTLTATWLPGLNRVLLDLGGPLAGGNYRFTLFGDDGMHDLSGLSLDGDGDTFAGGNYVRFFSVQPIVPPTFSGDVSGAGSEDGGPVTGTLSATDVFNTPVADFSIDTQATNGVATIDQNTGEWTYTPNSNFYGTDSFTVSSIDGSSNEGFQIVTVTIAGVDDPTLFGGDTSGTGVEDGSAISGILTASDPAEGMSAPNFTITSGPANGVALVDPNTGLWSYLPNAEFFGSDAFTLTVTDDAGNTADQIISLTIDPSDDPASFGGDLSGSGNEDGGAVTGTLTATDVDGLNTPNFTVSTAATNGVATIDSVTGEWTYTPNDDFFGMDSFEVTITDDFANDATQVIEITIESANDQPTFTLPASVASITTDGPQSVAGFVTDISPGNADDAGQTLVFLIISNDNPDLFSQLPGIDPNGTLTYTAALGASGVANIQVQLLDDGGTANGGINASVIQTFQIVINSPVVGADTGAFIDSNGNLLIIEGDEGNSNLTIKRVNVSGTDYLSVSERRGTVTSNISGAIQVNAREVRFEMTSFTGDLVISLLAGDDRVTLLGDLGILPGGIRIDGGDGFDLVTLRGSVELAADSDAVIESERIVGTRNASITTSGTGSITIDATNAATDKRYDAVNLATTTLMATGSGDITIQGVSGDRGNGNDGVRLVRSTLSVDTGDLRIEGTSAAGSNSAGIGVLVNRTSILQTGTGGGSILIDGESFGSGARARGLIITGRTEIGALGGGTITLEGTAAAGRSGNSGLTITSVSQVHTEDGIISITGIGGDGGSGNSGVTVASRTGITSDSGNILIEGTSGDGTAGNIGVNIVSRVTVQTLGSGVISLVGTGTGTTGAVGVRVAGRSSLITENGSLSLIGVASSPIVENGRGILGVDVNRSTLSVTGGSGSGAIQIDGEGGGGLDRNGGIRIIGGTITVAGSGEVKIDGEVTRQGRHTNVGANVGGRTHFETAQGNLSVNGISRGSGNSNRAVLISGVSGNLGGNVSIMGQTSLITQGRNNAGSVLQNANLEAGGSVTVTGQAGGGSHGNHGLLLNRSSATALAGDVTLNGTGHGTGNGNTGISSTRTTLSASGNLTANGRGSADAMGKNNTGISGVATTFTAGGTMSLTGTSGNGSIGNEGLRFVGGNLTASGALTLSGTSATDALNGVKNNNGLFFNRSNLDGGLGSSVAGSGGMGTLNNHGIVADRRTTVAGSLTIGDFSGTAGSGSGSEDLAGTLF